MSVEGRLDGLPTARPVARPQITARHEWTTWLVVAFAAYGLMFVAWVLLHPHASYVDALSDYAFLPVNLTAGLLAWRVARTRAAHPGVRTAWALIGTAFLSYWVGDCIWTWFDAIRHVQPSPSIADGFYLLFYPLLFAGLLCLPARPRTRADWYKVALDAATVLVGATLVVWYLVVGPIVHHGHESVANTLLNLAYPAGDLVIVFGAAMTLLRAPSAVIRPALRLLVVGVAVFVVADVVYAHASLTDTYTGGSLPDAFWMIAQVVLLAAAQQQWVSIRREPADCVAALDTSSPWSPPTVSRLPYLAMAAGYGLLVAVGLRQAHYPLGDLLLGSVALTSLVVTRQVAALRENVRLFAQVHELAVTDSLTGLRTRRSFVAEAGAWLDAGADSSAAIVMIDVDHFKSVNDGFGHAAGDAVLQAVAQRCRDVLRTSDVLARYGGDELVAFLPGSDIPSAVAIAERIRMVVAEDVILTEHGAVSVSLSLGVAAGTRTELEELLRRSDVALYDAKQAGRNCARIFALSPDTRPAATPIEAIVPGGTRLPIA